MRDLGGVTGCSKTGFQLWLHNKKEINDPVYTWGNWGTVYQWKSQDLKVWRAGPVSSLGPSMPICEMEYYIHTAAASPREQLWNSEVCVKAFWGTSDRLYFGGLQKHCRSWLQPWNQKTLALWKKSHDQPRQHIKKQRHYFANESPSSLIYGFSSRHVWIWELDHKESLLLLLLLSRFSHVQLCATL